MAMTDPPISLARVAKGVHASEWKIYSAERDHAGVGGIRVSLRGGLAAEVELELGRLGKFLRESGEIALRLRALEERPIDAVLVGRLLEAIGYDGSSAPPLLVERFTAILRGEP